MADWRVMSGLSRPGKVVLAYSGGLDTTIILKWLQSHYGAEVVTFTADLGQGGELEAARVRARSVGLPESNIFVEDLRHRFVTEFVFPMFRANAVYEGVYLLGTSIARPLIALRQVEIAHVTGADAVCHGATGKGNDQIRFEMGYYALDPDIRVVAPWREWDFVSRSDLMEFAQQHGLDVPQDARGEAPYSVDANLLHTSSEGKALEDPAMVPPDDLYRRTVDPVTAPDDPETVEIGFVQGDPVSINGEHFEPVALMERLNAIGGRHGVGRLDMVENRLVGMKSRGVYETPGGSLLLVARRGVEQVTLDRGAAHLKDELMPRYAQLVYDGLWFSPERAMLQAAIDRSQEHVTGTARLRVYRGGAHLIGRDSERSLYSQDHVTFEDDGGVYDPVDATGFSRIMSLRLRMLAARDRRLRRND